LVLFLFITSTPPRLAHQNRPPLQDVSFTHLLIGPIT